jgi:NADH:ubiquinone oxidoreductase subunit 4 (subunit M)
VTDWSLIVMAIPLFGAVAVGLVALRAQVRRAKVDESTALRPAADDVSPSESQNLVFRRIALLFAGGAFVAVVCLSLLERLAGLDLAVGGNPLSGAFALLTTATWLPVIDMAYRWTSGRTARSSAWLYALLLLIEASYLAIFSCDNALWLCAALVSNSVLLSFVAGGWSGAGSENVAGKMLFMNLAGDFAILVGVLGVAIALARVYGAQPTSSPRLTYSMSEMTRDLHALVTDDVAAQEYWKHAERALLTILLLGAALKSALVPFHAWFTTAVAEGHPCVGLALIGPGIRIGSYLWVRLIGPLETDLGAAAYVIVGLTILGALYQSLLAFGEANFKRMIGCVAVLQGSLTLAGLISMSPEDAGGPLMFTLASAVAGVLIVFAFNFLEQRLGAREPSEGDAPAQPASRLGRANRLAEVGGIVHKLPNLAAVSLVAVLSLVGIPGLFGFPGLYATLRIIFAGDWAFAFVAIAASLIGSWALFSMLQKLVFGAPRLPMPGDADVLLGNSSQQQDSSPQQWSILADGRSGSLDLGSIELLIIGPLLASLIALGIWPQVVSACLFLARASPPAGP